MIKRRIIILFISLSILFTGCVQKIEDVPVELNNSTVGQSYDMKSDFINTKTVTLYYPDLSSDNLLRIVKDVNVYQSSSEVSAVANRLLNYVTAEDDNFDVPFDALADVEWIIVSRNLASINLSGNFTDFTEKEMFVGIVSIVNTLCELQGIDYVEILFNGVKMQSRGLLCNPMSSMDSSLHLMYLDHVNIIEDENRKITRDKSILYFSSSNSDFLIAEISNVTVGSETAADDLFKLLKNEPYYGSGTKSCISQNVLMPSSPVITLEDNLNIMTIRLEAPKLETMENKTRYMMCGGITLTFLSYFDDVDAVRIYINGQPALEETVLYKDTFIENIGQIATVYLPNRDLDYLSKIDFAMSQQRYNSPKERVIETVLADTDYKSNTAKILSEEITEDDILSVFVHDSICVVNISNELYEEIKILPYDNRKIFLYSIVNTLTEFENINSVQFLVEKIVYENLGDNLCIETPLMNNPGLVFN